MSMPPFTTSPVALITGCTSGFGPATAAEMARAGFHVVAAMRNIETAGDVTEAVRQAGGAVTPIAMDVTEPGSVAQGLEAIRTRVGVPDVLVNNAGFAMAGYAEDVSDEELREQMDANFHGAVAVTKAVLPEMRARRRGRIISISSVAGRFGAPGLSAYCASKWALEGWFETLRYEVLPFGIFVSLVEPGVYPTEVFGSNRRISARAAEPSSPYRADYQRMAERFEIRATSTHADPVEVARTVARVAAAPHPRLRYPVGRGSHLATRLGPLTPEWLMERIRMGLLPGRG